MRHAANMLPFMIGFGMLGLAVFWPTYRFRTFYVCFLSLFGVMLGDEISNGFNEVIQFDEQFGPFYMFCWVFLSMSVMMNLFIIIVGESFDIVRETHKFNWLTDERMITMDRSQREFDDTSSSSSSDDSDCLSDNSENKEHKPHERPLGKKLRSVRALK